ncbi:DUF5615 family PIN-like protein [Prosthecobacter sp.]|uniref:DUF5615 family PIN-like protein n=1 Tax=Prosthecobacter sp. TaxID=1965333 RepID=UPI003784A0EE
MARFYSNENFHRLVVQELRERGHDVLTSLEAGRANQRIPDEKVLEYATNEGRAVLTFNRLHFMRLHRSTDGRHAGIIVCTMDHDTRALAQRIDDIIRDAGDLNGRLLRVNRPV